MRLSVWQLSTVVLLSVLLGQNLKTRPNTAEAASQDVFGSPQVVINCFKNQKGSFILWADGHISKVDAPDTTISTLSQCVDIPAAEDPPPLVTRDSTKPQGSPHVPVGMYQTSKGSYVLFADGSCKKPNGDAAAPAATHSSRTATFDGTSGAAYGDSSLVFSHEGTTGYYTINFQPPFNDIPVVVVNTGDHHYVAGVHGSVTKNSCRVWTARLQSPNVWSDQNCRFTISAFGE